MVASALKLHRTSGRALYVLVQLASIKLCGVVALFNCQLLSEVKPRESFKQMRQPFVTAD